MAGIVARGSNSQETKKVALVAYKVNLLKTITTEGKYSLKVEPWIPVTFAYQCGVNGVYNRVAIEFHSGSDFIYEDEVKILGGTTGKAGITTGTASSGYSFTIIPTEDTITFSAQTTKYGILAMSEAHPKVHVFQ